MLLGDSTPVHLHTSWQYGLDTLRQQGVPVEGLSFDSHLVIRGLIMDKEKGNLIKVDRFGWGTGGRGSDW